MGDIHDLKWQTREDMPQPTNALQELVEIITRTSRDTGEDKMIACMYGIIVGWDDDAYEYLKKKHGWTEDNLKFQKIWHENYKKAWQLFMEKERVKEKAETIKEAEHIEDGFRIIPGDEVNSIHSAIMKRLSSEQMIILRDKLIRRTPPLPNNSLPLEEMINELPDNRPLYHDSGLWQIRGDDMNDTLYQQECYESFYNFIKRCFDRENKYMIGED